MFEVVLRTNPRISRPFSGYKSAGFTFAAASGATIEDARPATRASTASVSGADWICFNNQETRPLDVPSRGASIVVDTMI
jgi:hypothetical protein